MRTYVPCMAGKTLHKQAPEKADLAPETREQLRALVKVLARAAAQADYEASQSRPDQNAKGS